MSALKQHVHGCRMRWTVRGIPRVPWNAEGVFDGVSTFRLDRKGKIYEHQASTLCSSEHHSCAVSEPSKG